MNIYIGEPVVVSDMQGPCPDGFHVPLSNEWQALCNLGTNFWGSNNGRLLSTYLKMPFAGTRYYESGSVSGQGEGGDYWSSSGVRYHAVFLFLYTNTIGKDYTHEKTYGHSIRAFKDSFVVPTSSWTVIQGTLGSAGVFWNQTDGLISVTGDGSTGYTIMDKNLGATTVYNYGDSLSEANCGYYYQRGNNYGFPFSGNITTSSTYIDASEYGPGNYYESSTFIKRSWNPLSWDYPVNNNLRGGVSQGTSTKTVPQEVKNIYIGEYKGWKPGSNTLAYFPLKEDFNDHSGNGITLTNTQYLSKQSLGYSFVASQGVSGTWTMINFTNGNAAFISMWVKVNSSSGNTVLGELERFGSVGYAPSHYDDTNLNNKFFIFTNSSYSVGATSNGLTFNEWHHITIGYDGSKAVISKDGVQETLYNGSGYNFGNQVVLCGIGSRGNANYTLSECIVETVARTEQEKTDYYNQTKSNYGL